MKLFGFLELDYKIFIGATSIITGLVWLWNRNNSYYKLIKEFRNKLPRRQTSATPFDNPFVPHITSLNLSTHETSLTEADLNIFFNELENFDYGFILNKKYYKKFSKNVLRFNPKAVNGNFDLVMVQEVLRVDPSHPLKPIDVFIYHLQFEYGFTSKIYFWVKRN
jgi:hypothetical protein